MPNYRRILDTSDQGWVGSDVLAAELGLIPSVLNPDRYASLGVANKSGFYFGPPTVTVTTTALSINTQLFAPLPVAEPVTIDRIGIEVTAGVASSTPRLSIWTKAGPTMTRVLDAGTVDGSTTGWKEITISQALQTGVYWLGLTMQGAACTVRAVNGWLSSYAGHPTALAFSAQAPYTGLGGQSVAGALPATELWSEPPYPAPRVLVRVA